MHRPPASPATALLTRESRSPVTTSTWRDAAGPIASGLCLIHCVGVAALAPLLPTAFSIVVQDRRVEAALWGTAALLGGWMLISARRRGANLLGPLVLLAWVLAAALGAWALLTNHDGAVQASLLGMAAAQLVVLYRKLRRSHAGHRHLAGQCSRT